MLLLECSIKILSASNIHEILYLIIVICMFLYFTNYSSTDLWFDMYLKDRRPLVLTHNPFICFNDDPRPAYRSQVNILLFALVAYLFLSCLPLALVAYLFLSCLSLASCLLVADCLCLCCLLFFFNLGSFFVGIFFSSSFAY